MIFVTVGTHEQAFDRLLREVDRLKGGGFIVDTVVMQTGFSEYIPKHCDAQPFYSYDEMNRLYEEAFLIITHGGPASFMQALAIGKRPIVVPRQADLGEHVNNHQLEFCHRVAKEYPILVVEDIDQLSDAIRLSTDNGNIEVQVISHNNDFCNSLEQLVNSL